MRELFQFLQFRAVGTARAFAKFELAAGSVVADRVFSLAASAAAAAAAAAITRRDVSVKVIGLAVKVIEFLDLLSLFL